MTNKGLFLSFGILFGGAALSSAQTPAPSGSVGAIPTPSVVNVESPAHPEWTSQAASGLDYNPSATRFWVSAEYLLWWLKHSPEPVPLATANPNPAFPDLSIGSPGTAVALGGKDIDIGTRSGGRIVLGCWLDPEHSVGIDGSFLFIANSAKQEALRSDGSFATGVPITITNAGFPNYLAFAGLSANPGNPFTGSHVLTVSNSLQSADVNGDFALTNTPSSHLSLLAGFRWMRLTERLVYDTASALANGDLVDAAGITAFFSRDDFATRNDFYGGQFGFRSEFESGKWSLTAVGKVALGNMNERLTVGGLNRTTSPTAAASGGIFAEPSNIGTTHRNEFAVVPEGTLTLGYQLTDHLRATVGYTFLYASSVARPGNQIDPTLNLNQTPLVGPARPARLLESTDFWAQGVNFGMEFRY